MILPAPLASPVTMLHLLALLALLGETAANCAYGTSLFPRLANVPVSDFSYDGLSGPLNWYGLNETANSACDKGTQQSPIVIDCTIPIVPAASVTWTVDDYPSGAEFENLGTNVEVVVNGSLIDNTSGTSYSLAQFHFHTPAEHRVNNVFYPMEMHWVFESAGTYLMSRLKKTSNPSHPYLAHLPNHANTSPQTAKDYAVIALLVDLCTQPDCTDPVLSAVFSGINDITSPGDAVMSAPLYFEELTSKFTGSTAWRCEQRESLFEKKDRLTSIQVQRLSHHPALQGECRLAHQHPAAIHRSPHVARRQGCHQV
jgi:carbonic anhydrase